MTISEIRGIYRDVLRYRDALRKTLKTETKAFGFTLVIWGTGALTEAQRGAPNKVAVVGFIGGALASMAVVILVTLGGPSARWNPQPKPSTQYALGSLHLFSICFAVSAGWAVTVWITNQTFAYTASSATAVMLYQLVLGVEVALAKAPDDEHSEI
jgi:hypothetical protein